MWSRVPGYKCTHYFYETKTLKEHFFFETFCFVPRHAFAYVSVHSKHTRI